MFQSKLVYSVSVSRFTSLIIGHIVTTLYTITYLLCVKPHPVHCGINLMTQNNPLSKRFPAFKKVGNNLRRATKEVNICFSFCPYKIFSEFNIRIK